MQATPPPTGSAAPSSTPWQLIVSNSIFTRIWVGQLISMAGDWIAFVALLSWILELTGSSISVSLLLVCGTVPALIFAPLAGVVADRCDRRRVMIAADVARTAFTLCLLLIDGPADIWMAYVLTAANVAASSFFNPAAAAALPNLVTTRQLTAANALLGASSGVMLAVGAVAGGLVAANLGRPAAFMLDALSFLVSAFMIGTVHKPFSAAAAAAHAMPWPGLVSTLRRSGLDFGEAFRYAAHRREVAAVLLIRTGGALGGGLLALLSVVPIQVFHAGDLGVGILYAVRGLGSIVGAMLAPLAAGPQPLSKLGMSVWGIMLSGIFCAAFSASPHLAWAAFFVFMAYVCGTLQWVFPPAILQQFVPDRILGRVFALEMLATMTVGTASTLLCGWAIASSGTHIVGLVMGGLMALYGAAWLAWFSWLKPLRFSETSEPAGHQAAQSLF